MRESYGPCQCGAVGTLGDGLCVNCYDRSLNGTVGRPRKPRPPERPSTRRRGRGRKPPILTPFQGLAGIMERARRAIRREDRQGTP